MKPLAIGIRLLLVSFLFAFFGYTLAAPPYSFKTIDVPGSSETSAYGINDAGHIVGTYVDNFISIPEHNFVRHGFLFKNHNFSSIDPIPPPRSTDYSARAYGINSNDKIVGAFTSSLGSFGGFLYDGSAFSFINSASFFVFQINGINAAGVICGFGFSNETGRNPGFVLKKGIITVIDVPKSTITAAFGLNNAEDVVGIYADTANKYHGFLFRNHRFTTIDRFGATATIPYGINSGGDIVGTVVDANGTHGFLLANNRFVIIDFPDSTFTEAFGINSDGDIVGDYRDAAGRTHGFLAIDQRFMISPFSRP